MVERVKTGIDKLDKALMGGFPKGNLVLVSGGAGTGKSTLCMQFLINGIEKFKEKGLYISTEQKPEELLKHASTFGWKLQDLEKKGLFKIHFIDIVKRDRFLNEIKKTVDEFKPQRIVIDSMSTLTDYSAVSDVSEHSPFSMVEVQDKVIPATLTEEIITKKILYHLINQLKEFGTTTLLISELEEGTATLSADSISEFICDGVIILNYLGVGSSVFRTLRIRKMRYSDHEKGSLPYEIGPKGIEIKEEEIELK